MSFFSFFFGSYVKCNLKKGNACFETFSLFFSGSFKSLTSVLQLALNYCCVLVREHK